MMELVFAIGIIAWTGFLFDWIWDQVSDDGSADDTPPEDDTMSGTAGPDMLYGDVDDNIIEGGRGDDTIFGYAGHDILDGGRDNDILSGGPGDDLLFGRQGADEIYGGIGNDLISGGWGNDMVYGGPGDDFVSGDQGNDDIYGEAGNDTLLGFEGNDRLYGDSGGDLLIGGEGSDTLRGASGNDALFGEGGTNDRLFGGSGNDWLYAGVGDPVAGGSELMRGGAGDDTLILRARDQAFGDGGADAFYVQAAPSDAALDGFFGDDWSVIKDYTPGEDTISVAYNPADYAVPPTISVNVSGADTFIHVNADVLAVVKGNTTITAGDISLVPDYDLVTGLTTF
jgi:Ca2+-binding RTX toxin-like protein